MSKHLRKKNFKKRYVLLGCACAVLVGVSFIVSSCRNNDDSEPEPEYSFSNTEIQKKETVKGIILSENTIDLEVGNEKVIEATFDPSDAEDKDVSWESSDTSVAEVDSQGKIKAISAGNCSVTVKLISNPDIQSNVDVSVLSQVENKDNETEAQDEPQSESYSNNESSYSNSQANDSETYYGDWKTVIVNSERAVPSNWSVSTTNVAGSTVDVRIAPALRELLDAAYADGVSTSICSGYRSIETQQRLVDNSVASFRSQGYSYDEALRLTYKELAVPGHSEHNLGLAVDFYSSETGLTEDFAYTPLGKWLKENAHKYGFILRYAKEKEHITGITYEPWHYRYVGVENAANIRNSGLCMEEYFG